MCDKELLIDYLYGELTPADRESCDRHLASCAECRDEIAGLRGTRAHLESWAPPEPDLGFQIVRGPQHLGASRRRWRWSPAWGLAAAAMLVGAVSAAIANVEVTADSGGVTIRTGWNRDGVQAAPAGTVPAADLKRVEARMRELEAKLAAGPVLTPVATPSSDGGMSDAELVRMVRRMIEQSEERQQGVFANQVLQVNRDMEVARRADLDGIRRSMEQMQRTNIDTYRMTKTLEDAFVRVGWQR
jgi:Putative zinc-finger